MVKKLFHLNPPLEQTLLRLKNQKVNWTQHCTEVHFASFLSGGFITVIVVNPPESKLAKRTSVHCV